MIKRLAYRLLSVLLAILWLATQQAAADWLINSYRFAAAAPATPTLTFLQCSGEQLTGPALTFASTNVGSVATSSRYTIIGILAKDGSSAYAVSSVTVAGDAATQIVEEPGGGIGYSGIYWLNNTTGTSEDIVVTFNEAITG